MPHKKKKHSAAPKAAAMHWEFDLSIPTDDFLDGGSLDGT